MRSLTNVSTILLVILDDETKLVNILPVFVTVQVLFSWLITGEPLDQANKALSVDSVTLTYKNASLEHAGVLSDQTIFPVLEEKGTDFGLIPFTNKMRVSSLASARNATAFRKLGSSQLFD